MKLFFDNNLFTCAIYSVILQFLFFLLFTNFSAQPEKMILERGSAVSLHFSNTQSKGAGEITNENTNTTEVGTKLIEEEIENFRQRLGYPADALDQDLESSCEWLLIIGEDGHPVKILNRKHCEYSIFERHFESEAKKWKFKLPKETELIIPVLFKVKKIGE
jgi:hypothetical protein